MNEHSNFSIDSFMKLLFIKDFQYEKQTIRPHRGLFAKILEKLRGSQQ